MSMHKKILILFILFCLIIPQYVFAEDFDSTETPDLSQLLKQYKTNSKENEPIPVEGEIYIPESNLPLIDYKLGPGDMIDIYIWAKEINLSYHFIIGPEGKIFIPRIGAILVNNLTTSNVEKLIKAKTKQLNTNVNVSVMLKRIRSIKIFVTGQVKTPGVYVVPIYTRLSELIKSAGGITENGSMRKIEISYENKQTTTIDFYKFMYEGNINQNPKIETGCQIVIPLKEQKVALLGQVARPGIFEINKTDKFDDILFLAGSTLPDAALNEITLWRNGLSGEQANAQTINFLKQTFPSISDGDVIYIPSYKTPLESKVVYVSGQIRKPGGIPFKVGAKLTDYINLAGGATEQADLQAVQITRPRFNKNEDINIQTINVYKILYEGKMDQDPDIKAYDIIYVPEKFFSFRNFNEITGLALTILGMASLIISITRK